MCNMSRQRNSQRHTCEGELQPSDGSWSCWCTDCGPTIQTSVHPFYHLLPGLCILKCSCTAKHQSSCLDINVQIRQIWDQPEGPDFFLPNMHEARLFVTFLSGTSQPFWCLMEGNSQLKRFSFPSFLPVSSISALPSFLCSSMPDFLFVGLVSIFLYLSPSLSFPFLILFAHKDAT